jgi:hypothetical protein
MNRVVELKKRQQAVALDRQNQQKELEADIKKRAEACRRFVADKRHADYRAFWDEIREGLKGQRDNLAEIAGTTEEYTRKALILDTKINTISWMLNTPEKFVLIDKNIKEKEQGQ